MIRLAFICGLGVARALGATAALAVVLALGTGARAEPRPVVVELFTSQGCSSCPPADKLVGVLKDAPGVIALSMHVDYWDYIGWDDPYAQPKFTQRQKHYVAGMERRYVYTPQMIVDGRYDAVGSREGEVREAIAKARNTPTTVRPRFEAEGDAPRVLVPAADVAGAASVYIAFYDDKHVTEVASGENAGRTLKNYNVVRRFERLGTWTGDRAAFPVDMGRARANGRDGCAVIVQTGRTGAVLGAATLALAEPSG